MKKILTTLALLVATTILLAQAPQKFSYQGVIRDAAGNLVRNAPVGVRVSLLKASADGVAVYCETHRQSTNANGLLTLTIGDGTVVGGDMAAIDWADGPYFLKTETDITGGSNYTLVGSQQLLSVPYALYAGNTTNGFSGDYNDLSNKPEIPQVPIDVSAFTNDAGYISNKECDNLSYCQLVSQLTKLQNTVDSLKEKVQEGGGYANDSLHSAKIEQLLLPIVNTLKIEAPYNVVVDLIYLGRSNVLECGICWSTLPNPTLLDEYVIDSNSNRTVGSYKCVMKNLLPNTDYYVRGYATNCDGTAYGTVIKFKTSSYGTYTFPCTEMPTITDNGGNIYNTVELGPQCWMAENLHCICGNTVINKPLNNTSASYVLSPATGDTLTGYKYNYRGAFSCPSGWHLPTGADWDQLFNYFQQFPEDIRYSSGFLSKPEPTVYWIDCVSCSGTGRSVAGLSGTGGSRISESVYMEQFYSVRCVKD